MRREQDSPLPSSPGVPTSADHEQLRGMVNRVADAVIGVAATGVVTSWNAAAETIYRRPAAAAIGMQISDAVGTPVDAAALSGIGTSRDDTHYTADGAELAVRVSAVRFDDSHLLISSDRTELRRAAQLLQAVVEALAEGIVVFDKDGAISTINPAAVEMFGLDVDDLPADHARRIATFTLFGEDGSPIPAAERPIMQTLHTGQTIRHRIFGIDRTSPPRQG